jgi:hypothetical protein
MNKRIINLVKEIVKDASQNKNVIAITLEMADSFYGYYLRLHFKDENEETDLGTYRLEGLSNEDIETHLELDKIITDAGFELNRELDVYFKKSASLLDKITFVINNYGFKENIESIDEIPEELQKLPIIEEREDDEKLDRLYDADAKYILFWQTYYYPVPNARHIWGSGYIIIPKKYL